MEGGAGYFAVAIALMVALVVTPASILLTLYWRGVRKIWLFIGLITVCLAIFAMASAGFGLWCMAQPHILNTNGSTPQLEFEIKPPDGQSVESLTGVEAELDTDRNVNAGILEGCSSELRCAHGLCRSLLSHVATSLRAEIS